MSDLKIITATDLKWTNAAHTSFDCTVTFEGLDPMPYHAVQGDIVAHGAELFSRGAAGEFGAIAEYVTPPTPVPQTVSAAQGGIALINASLMDAVQAAVDAAETPAAVKWAWAHAQDWERSSPALAYLADKAGITSAQMDSLFIAAAQITA